MSRKPLTPISDPKVRRAHSGHTVVVSASGGAAPYPIVLRRRLRGMRTLGVTLAQGIREGA